MLFVAMSQRLLAGILISICASPLLAQAQGDTPQQRMEESVSVGYVMIPFTPLTRKGAPITDLKSGEVELFVDGQPVRSDMFEKSENAPVSFTILLDASGSMALAGKMDAARAAIGALAAHRRPYGKTAFFDALSTMPERSRLGKNSSRAIILLSDGIDNASTLTRRDLARLLQGVAVPIYPLGIRDPREAVGSHTSEELSDLDLLREVATLTGGKLTLGNEPQQIALAVASLEKDLRAQYLLGFTPTGHVAVKYHEISLKLAGRIRSVRVRAGYLGTEPPLITSRRNERKRS